LIICGVLSPRRKKGRGKEGKGKKNFCARGEERGREGAEKNTKFSVLLFSIHTNFSEASRREREKEEEKGISEKKRGGGRKRRGKRGKKEQSQIHFIFFRSSSTIFASSGFA